MPIIPFTTSVLLIGGCRTTKNLVEQLIDPKAEFRVALTASLGLQAFLEKRASLVIIDDNLPANCTYSLVKQIRFLSTASIVQLSNDPTDSVRLTALENGVDYFMTYPVIEREFSAIIKSCVRHGALASTSITAATHEQDVWHCCTIDQRLYAPNGMSVHITNNEMKLIEVLAEQNGKQVDRELFAAKLHRMHTVGFDKLLNVSIYRLRKKISLACNRELPMTLIRGGGVGFEGQLILLPLEPDPH